MSVIRRLIDRLYPRSASGYKVILLGLDAAGKTTLLYKLKLGEVVVTIPTIGFNVETIQVRSKGGRLGKLDCWDVGGGCGKFSASFLKAYTSDSDALVWFVDSCDRERIAESVEELRQNINILATDATNPGQTSIPVLIVATKQDLPNSMFIDEIRVKFAQATKGSSFFLTGTTLKQNLNEGAFPDALGWLLAAIEGARAGKPLSSPPAVVAADQGSAAALERTLEAWLVRAEKDAPPDEFLRQFAAIDLPAWDHYTHIRIAYLMLMIHGRQKGKNMIFDGIERYIAQSTQTRGRTFHVTMTYFWIQMVHFGIRSMPPPVPAFDDEPKSMSDKSSTHTLVNHDGASADNFVRFLLLNPFVADGNLWAEYYSKEVIMSPAAKVEMALPDKKPLPNLVSRESVSSAVKSSTSIIGS
ncbi:ADP-ribosylation factor family-domain-containing protein [Mycena rosella]|uniref:ADP-ribosylation factor family-domain-containing protein n=1 Tax=Mycena rosella TaxID=1033263 RepID=A0AAD7MAM4_MYCRO|nr:ADP-ribosylation factor family-domain-containing protein [Mycena rosella]